MSKQKWDGRIENGELVYTGGDGQVRKIAIQDKLLPFLASVISANPLLQVILESHCGNWGCTPHQTFWV